MNEERPVNLHFFVKEDADNFSKICFSQKILHSIRHDPEGYYVKTDPVTLQRRRELVKAWAKAAIHEERQ